MNINSKPESQPEQPKRKSIFGLVSLVFALLAITISLYWFSQATQGIHTKLNVDVLLNIVFALSPIAIIAGGVDLYLTNRKIPVGGILASITGLTFFTIIDFNMLASASLVEILLLCGFVFAIIQIILLIKNRVAILARLGIALALLGNVFVLIFLILLNIGQ